MNVNEGNELIMNFLGGSYSNYFDGTQGVTIPKRGVVQGGIQELKYHSSYDWLIPVVEHIVGLGWAFQLNSHGIDNDAKFVNGDNYIQNVAWSTPLLATYNVVVDFIKWYNENCKSTKTK